MVNLRTGELGTARQTGADRRPREVMRAGLLSLLRCASCGSSLVSHCDERGAIDRLVCSSCGISVPVSRGIPRFIDEPADDRARRTQASFGYEWTHFNDWRPSGQTNFNDYFQGLELEALRESMVLDAGCGMGRHTVHVAPFAGNVIAVDFSRAIDTAAANASALSNVDCIQADLLALPLADASFDFIYSLGVLHHLSDTEQAVAVLARKLRPGGRLRIYLYWKRRGWKGALLSAVNAVRVVTTRMPFGLLKACCLVLSAVLFAGVVLPYQLLSFLGVRSHRDLPLFVYSKYPFNVLYNDQFDRFSAPIEKRYDPDDVRALLEHAGLRGVEIRRSYGWLADGFKPR